METAIIAIIFSLAVFYLGKNTFSAFFSKNKSGCAKGCGSCGGVDFDKIIADQSKSTIQK